MQIELFDIESSLKPSAPTPLAPQWRQLPAPILDAVHVGSGAWLLTAATVRDSEVYVASENGLHDGSDWVAGQPTLNWSIAAIPRDESDALRWSSCPFAREAAGDGMWSEDPVHFVLPYWIGRWARLW